MPRKGEQFAGLTVAIVTPFRNDRLDEAALKKIIDFQIEAGTTAFARWVRLAKAPL